VQAWFPAILPGAATDGGTASDGEADGVGAGPVGTGAGDGVGVAVVGVGDSAGDGVSVGLPGLRSGPGRPTGTIHGFTPMSRRPTSSIPIQDKKARVGLWRRAISLAVQRDSHAQERDIHAPLIARSNTLTFLRYTFGQQKRRDFEAAPFKFLLSTFRVTN
jgi:hypothetical protein